jgi:nucleoside-diphosphate-sugar epimerase
VTDVEKRTILLTGAAGRIGTAFYAECRGSYRFRLADKSPELLNRTRESGDEAVVLDIADFSQCADACQGIETVVHLAADPSPEADFNDSLLANNFQGTYNVFRAAADAGCRRVVFASSVHAVLGYPDSTPVPESAPVWPANMYGVSKCFGEATGRKFATSNGLSCIAIRIGAYEAEWIKTALTTRNLSAYLSPRDLNQLIRRCIEAEGIDFAIVHGISNNRIKRLSIDETRRLVSYEPVDDGFEKYSVLTQ